MTNQVSLVGRLVRTPEMFTTDSGRKGSFVTLAVGRQYKNQDGEYETDFIDCTLWTGVAERTCEYCKSGDIIGIRGRVQTRIMEDDNGNKYKRMEIVAERVTFLASTKHNEDETNKDITDHLINIDDESDSND